MRKLLTNEKFFEGLIGNFFGTRRESMFLVQSFFIWEQAEHFKLYFASTKPEVVLIERLSVHRKKKFLRFQRDKHFSGDWLTTYFKGKSVLLMENSNNLCLQWSFPTTLIKLTPWSLDFREKLHCKVVLESFTSNTENIAIVSN